MTGPLVSILMTTYNSQEFVGSAIESLLSQSYENIEIIVVDDASNDKTISILKSLSKQHVNIKYFLLPHNCGTYLAKTVAFKFARGEFITCHDSDDWSHPERISRQIMPLLINNRLIATTSNWVRIQNNGTLFARGVFPLVRLNPASPMFRRSKVRDCIGLWDLVKTGADSEFIARLELVFGRSSMLKIKEPLCFGSHRSGSLMTDTKTGYKKNGSNKQNHRLDYCEAWGQWHINSLSKYTNPKIKPLNSFVRSFEASEKLTVSNDTIKIIKQYLKNVN